VAERKWELSLAAENDAKIQHLARLTRGVVNHGAYDESVISRLSRYSMDVESDEMDAMLREYTDSEFYAKLDDQQRHEVERATRPVAGASWKYGSTPYEDGLWGFDGPVESQPYDAVGAVVLSGLAGAELFGKSERLDRYAAALEPDILRRAVLIGGVAMVMSGRRGWRSSISYRGTAQQGLVPETHIGGTIHGDFWTSRRHVFEQDPISPLGEKLPFAPLMERVYIPAYHSSEPSILAALLGYQVGYQKADAGQLYANLTTKFAATDAEQPGPFGDYGDRDGLDQAHHLSMMSEGGVGEGDVLARLIIYPGDFDSRCVLTAKQEGVEFAYIPYKNTEMEQRFTLPSHEIEDYAVTLFGSGFGRTSQSALMSVVAALRDGSPYSQPQRTERDF